MNRINYDDRLHLRYHEGRALDDLVFDLWRSIVRRFAGGRSKWNVLDLGSGTGRFSALLADELDSDVVGVEPSDKMRTVAETECKHPRVRFVKGSAEAIPLPDNSVDLAWISQVIHHIPDIELLVQEFRRVVKDGGLILVRSNFKGRLKGSARYYEFFPAGLAADEARHPAVDQIRDAFERSGFCFVGFETVEQEEARSLQQYAERISMRTYSTFELISEQDYQTGLKALRAAASQEQDPQPVMGKVDLLVFRREP